MNRPLLLMAACAAVSILPLLVFWREFDQLFFFHDDFLLLHELSGLTPFQWIFHPFAGESIFPLFKLLWISAISITGGSYAALIVLQWLTHGAVCFTLGWLLLRLRLPPLAAAFAVLSFGLPSSNIETLAWSIQWGAQLNILFFLLAWHALLTIRERPVGFGWHAWYVTAIVASALCSSRGVVCGMVLALFIVLCGEGRRRVWLCVASVLPTALLTLATWLYVPPFKESHVGHFIYSLNYLVLNPFYALLPVPWHLKSVSPLLVLGLLKLLLIGWAFYKGGRPLRPFLIALVAFDTATAAALGYARTWTGLSTAVSSRYQYMSLLVLAPMLGIVIAGWRKQFKVAGFVLWIWFLTYRWPGNARHWSITRGSQLRYALWVYPPNRQFDPSKLTAGEARDLIEEYHLH